PPGPARRAHRAGARGAGAHGAGADQLRDRRGALHLGRGGREARDLDLHQARPAAHGRGPPPGARRAALAGPGGLMTTTPGAPTSAEPTDPELRERYRRDAEAQREHRRAAQAERAAEVRPARTRKGPIRTVAALLTL